MLKKQYVSWVKELKQNIEQQKLQTVLQVNTNLLLMYWYVGKQINNKIEIEGWGTKVIEQLSIDLQKAFSDEQGFSRRNLFYMKKFAEAYPDLLIVQPAAALLPHSKNKPKNTIVQPAAALLSTVKNNQKNTITQPVVAQFNNEKLFSSNPLLLSISWSHHIAIVEKCSSSEERFFYVNKVIKEGWSKAVLKYHLDTDLFNRQHKKSLTNNFKKTLPKVQSELANEIFKDPYKFDFLNLGTKFTEKELEDTLIKHIKDFLVELGNGFAYVGQQYKLKVGKKDKYLDLLFYHLQLRCFVVIDLKVGEFEFTHTGQMIGYLNVVDKQLKHALDNPSIGIILCGEKDDIEVDYALYNVQHAIGVSEYKYMKKLPKKYKDVLPTASVLKQEVEKYLRQTTSTKKKK
jgi:predicted nuclease of restriction endonuclease-like (RecB) superfamily